MSLNIEGFYPSFGDAGLFGHQRVVCPLRTFSDEIWVKWVK